MSLAGYEKPGGSAYSVPYSIHLADDPERVEYEVVQSWEGPDEVFLIRGEWFRSWAEVEQRITADREGK